MNNQTHFISFSFFAGVFVTLIIIWGFFVNRGQVTILPDASVYEGDIQDGRFNGEGKLVWPDGAIYEGNFLDGMFHGQGKQVKPDLWTYEGEFKYGKISGYGTMTYSPDIKYVGEFESGYYHGEGTFYSVGSVYKGDYVDNQIIKGFFESEDGTHYEGEFKQWLFDGNGVLIEPGGDRFQGVFLQGELHGPGEYWGSDGRYYKGDFNYGYFDGQGVLTYTEPGKPSNVQSGVWRYGELVKSDNGQLVVTPESLNEIALYNQNELLKNAWNKIQVDDKSKTELYFMGIAGDGSQGVFRREIQYIENQFSHQFLTLDKSISLINSRDTVQDIPLASKTSIKETLSHLVDKMDVENDILFLYMTSHGSKNNGFSLKQPKLGLPDLTASELSDMLKDTPIKWKVIIISACYSGQFIEPLKDENTLIITAASEQRESFGCSDLGSFTYFGEAYFNQALNQTNDFVKAFEIAKVLVEKRESQEGRQQSIPQIYSPDGIKRQLKKWRNEAGLNLKISENLSD